MSADEALKMQGLADRIREAMGLATMLETVEALSLIAAQNADECQPGSANESAWNGACTNLLELTYTGRLYRPALYPNLKPELEN